jgi:carboxymethylenebutenolidase
MSIAVAERRSTGKGGTPVVIFAPSEGGTRPCVFVMPERYGLVPHTLDIARRIALNGYVSAVPDLMHAYPDQAALHRGDVGCEPSDDDILRMLDDTVPVVGELPNADTARLAMIGICQSGRYPLIWAAKRPVSAAVIFYGAAHEAEWHPSDIHPVGVDGLIAQMARTNVLGIFGEGDHVISISDVCRFRNELERRNHSYQITLYPEVPHGWLNDTMPGRYRRAAAEAAWTELLAYLGERLTGPTGPPAEVEWQFRARSAPDYDFSTKVRYE